MFSSLTIAFIASALAVPATTGAKPTPKEINRVSVNKVAFANSLDDSLFLTAFDPNPFGGKDYVYYINDAASVASGAKVTPQRMPGNVVWPNTVAKAPASLFGQPGVLISGGFLVPGRGNGGLWWSAWDKNTAGTTVELFRGRGYFYHQAVFYDVNQDGQMDILTCRANKGFTSAGKGDLTWLEPVNRLKPLGKWKETVIGKGCDTLFRFEDINGDGKIDILAPEFWGKKLTLIQSPDGRFDIYKNLVITTIASDIGSPFDAEFVDVNGDGKKDVLVTNHESDGKGAVFVYEVPADVKQPWPKHVIAKDFPVLISGPGQASPGAALAFHPTTNKSGKAHVVVSGDAAKKAYVLVPANDDVNDWTFETTILHDCDSTVGMVSISDFDKNGIPELYVPCYEKNYLAVYSY
jgi:hypothetical protein